VLFDAAFNALASGLGNLTRYRQVKSLRPRFVYNRLGNNVLGGLVERGREPEKLVGWDMR
jgi:hypothetical protein